MTKKDICAHHLESRHECLPVEVVRKVALVVDDKSDVFDKSKSALIKELKNKLNCDDELCIIQTIDDHDSIDKDAIMFNFFKPHGLLDETDWLSNSSLDIVQAQLYKLYPTYYYSYIHMVDLVMIPHQDVKYIDYNVVPIKEIDFVKELTQPFSHPSMVTNNGYPMETYSIICNTDPSHKGGQHWYSMFFNFRSAGTINDPYTIEYFNSSGYDIKHKEFREFFEKLALDITDGTKKCCKFVKVSNIQHQASHTGNCGVYSLYYIICRLKNVPMSYFGNEKIKISDTIMTQFRQNLFRKEK